MAKNWSEKVKRREKELSEVNRLAILDLCDKKAMDYNQLRSVFENLPPVVDIVATPEMAEDEIQELIGKSTQTSEEIQDFEVDSSILEGKSKEEQEYEENKEDKKENDNDNK